jgi:hypothetical protein
VGTAPKKTAYILLEKTVVQRVPDPEQPERIEEVEAFIPVRGLGSGEPPMPANSGPEACRLYARDRGVDEGEGTLHLRAVSERNWSGTDVGLELQLSFSDVLPPSRKRRSRVSEGQAEPETGEPEPIEEPAAT